METRPKIKISLTTTDNFIEAAGWLALLLIWGITFYQFKNLPETIPTHFNITGEADGFGKKSTIFLLPVFGTVLFIGLTILNFFPHVFNYPVKITPENAAKQYEMATRLVRVLKLSVLIIFIMIIWMTSAVASAKMNGLAAWFVPVVLAVTFIPLGYYIYKSFRNK